MHKIRGALLIILFLLISIFELGFCSAVNEGRVLTSNNGRQEVTTYLYYIPESKSKSSLPILVYIGGLNSTGEEFMTDEWIDFSNQHGFMLLALGFRFVLEDWSERKSYQFPEYWSGKLSCPQTRASSVCISTGPAEGSRPP